MYECRVQARFSAAHQVRLHDGTLEPVHGHDWEVEAIFRGERLDAAGMLVDFVAAERELAFVVGTLQHTHLNEAPALGGLNPTAENVARWILEELSRRLPGAPAAGVVVREAPGCFAGYFTDV